MTALIPPAIKAKIHDTITKIIKLTETPTADCDYFFSYCDNN